jgi:hypothetical protein
MSSPVIHSYAERLPRRMSFQRSTASAYVSESTGLPERPWLLARLCVWSCFASGV